MTIQLSKEGGRWVARFRFSYEVKDLVKAAGFRFDPAQKVWWTDKETIAAKLQGGDESEIAKRLTADGKARQAEAEVAIAASRATNADIEIPRPPGDDSLDYLPYQKAGIAYAMGRPATLIGDEMGLGKTIQAIGVINADPTIAKVLVICPASLKLNWQRELRRWLARELPAVIVDSNKGSFPSEYVGGPGVVMPVGRAVVIINYEQVGKYRAAIDAVAWDLLVVDECHYLKNPKAQRTAAVLGRWDRDPEKKVEPIKARRRVFLTGTPLVNRPVELWPLVRSLDPQGLGKSWRNFTNRYCAAHHNGYGMDLSGASHLDELQGKLRSTIMVRRLKADVLSELPPKRRQVIALPPDLDPTGNAGRAVEAERDAMAQYQATLDALRLAVELAKASENKADYEAAVAQLSKGASVAFEKISEMRHNVALAKLPLVAAHVTDALETGNKIILFCHHLDVTEILAEAFANAQPAIITGKTPIPRRMEEVDRFQNDPNCRVIIGTIGAMGVGLTLTASSHVIFAELDWVPGNLSQSEDRAHRIGQTDSVLVQHLVLDGSLDANMAATLVAKQDVLDRALDKNAALPEARVFEAPPAADEDKQGKLFATAKISRSLVEKNAPLIGPAAVAAIHRGLQMLAGMCDGAIALDNAGFNRMDAAIGHSLASAPRLTAKQAVLGRALIQRYRRQLPAELVATATQVTPPNV